MQDDRVAPERWNLKAASQQCGIPVRTLRRWAQAGRLQATLEAGPRGPVYWVTADALDAAIAASDEDNPTDPVAPSTEMVLRPDVLGLLDRLAALVEEQRQVNEQQRQQMIAQTAEMHALLDRLAAWQAEQARPWWRRLLGLR